MNELLQRSFLTSPKLNMLLPKQNFTVKIVVLTNSYNKRELFEGKLPKITMKRGITKMID